MSTGRLDNRVKIRGALAPIGATTTVLACLALGLPAAQAAPGTDDVFGEWVLSGDTTEPQTDPTQPADPDGESGEGNIANVIQLGEVHVQRAQGTVSTERSGWVREVPAGSGWVQLLDEAGERWVEDSPATRETTDWLRTSPGSGWATIAERQVVDVNGVEGDWVNYTWKGGPVTGAPAFPGEDIKNWQRNNGNHNGHPQPTDADKPGLTYQRGEAGNADWFHWEFEGQVDEVTHTEYRFAKDTPAVAHQEFSYERLVTTEGALEYYWSIYERTNTAGQPGEEPIDPTDPTDPAEPNVPTIPTVPTAPSAPSLNGGTSGPNGPAKGDDSDADESPEQNESSPRPAARGTVPLSIDAGL